MYRFVFFKIPFMRGGYRVPACPPHIKPIDRLYKFRVAEVVTDLAFAETQREIIVDGSTAVAVDEGNANYVYIAQTTNRNLGKYVDDVRGAYYWLDDLQFVGVQKGSDTPAAVVTISPDVWLTDFCSGFMAVRGRLAQSSLLLAGEPRTPLVAPVYDISQVKQYDMLRGSQSFFLVGVFALADGAIYTLNAQVMGIGAVDAVMRAFGGVETITAYNGSAKIFERAASCTRIYMLPQDFAETTDGVSLVADSATDIRYVVHAADASVQDVDARGFVLGTDLGGDGLRRVKNVTAPPTATNFNNVNSRAWVVTPARFVSLDAVRGIEDSSGASPTLAAFYLSATTIGDDSMQIYMQVGDEFIDVSNDFLVDFAVNEKAVQQAQQKQLVALQAITGVIGAAGGFSGGLASGNYFGAVQAIAGGVETFASLGAAKRTPAQIRGNGGAMGFYAMTNTLVMIVSCETLLNGARVTATEKEYGWKYDNAPYYDDGLEYDNYYRFSDVVIYGNMTGGQGAQREIANAFVSGVRLVDITKL